MACRGSLLVLPSRAGPGKPRGRGRGLHLHPVHGRSYSTTTRRWPCLATWPGSCGWTVANPRRLHDALV